MNTILKIIVISLLILSFGCSSHGKLQIQKIGDRKVVVGDVTYHFPWYHVKADHNEIRSDRVWRRINAPPGTVTSYIAQYGAMEWGEYHDDMNPDYTKSMTTLVENTKNDTV